MDSDKKYLFGPVPSRRLGLSLGVDIVPFKHCSLDCVYCQLGRTTEKTIERREYVAVKAVLAELEQKLKQGLVADYITLSGSGEPTLNSKLGELIEKIKKITDIPIAVITNGTLLYRPDVRAECTKADLVLPSLDAADEKIFQKINRPHHDISIEKLVSGLCDFRKEFAGPIWLEVFVIDGINTDVKSVKKLKDTISCIRPDKVQLNTAVRPTADMGIEKIKLEKMEEIAARLGENVEIIADFSRKSGSENIKITAEDVLSMLKRRPCSLDDICAGLRIHRNEALKYIGHFQSKGFVSCYEKDGVTFFRAD